MPITDLDQAKINVLCWWGDGRLLFGFPFWALPFVISSYESLRLLSESSRSLQTWGWSVVSPWRAETPSLRRSHGWGEQSLHAAFSFTHLSQGGTTFLTQAWSDDQKGASITRALKLIAMKPWLMGEVLRTETLLQDEKKNVRKFK